MNLTRTSLTLLLICIAHLTHAKDKAEVEPKGHIKRYTYKLARNHKMPFIYTCYYDKQGRKIIDSSYGYYEPGSLFNEKRVLFVSEYSYNGRFAYRTGYMIKPSNKEPRVVSRDTLEYNEQQQLISKTEWKFIIDTLHDVSTYAYYPDGRLKEEIEDKKIASKKFGFGKHRTTYAYPGNKEITTHYGQVNNAQGWVPSYNTTREFDDSGRVIQMGLHAYDYLKPYIQVAYSDAPQQPTPARRKGAAREIDLRYYWHRDHHGNYLKKATLKGKRLKEIIERTIEYYE